MIPNYRPVGRNESKQNVYTPYVKVKLAYDNNPANTILYKYIGNIFDDKDQERPVYVMTNKKGLNQEGRVVKEYDNYSNSMFELIILMEHQMLNQHLVLMISKISLTQVTK